MAAGMDTICRQRRAGDGEKACSRTRGRGASWCRSVAEATTPRQAGLRFTERYQAPGPRCLHRSADTVYLVDIKRSVGVDVAPDALPAQFGARGIQGIIRKRHAHVTGRQ